jgi:hypothetical protein
MQNSEKNRIAILRILFDRMSFRIGKTEKAEPFDAYQISGTAK